MTPFEYCVLAIATLLVVTNMVGFAHHPRLTDMPRSYVAVVLALLAIVILSLINIFFNGVFL
jgi:hypothetical protein